MEAAEDHLTAMDSKISTKQWINDCGKKQITLGGGRAVAVECENGDEEKNESESMEMTPQAELLLHDESGNDQLDEQR